LYTLYIKDRDDYFFIVDRKKDMIIAAGYNVYPKRDRWSALPAPKNPGCAFNRLWEKSYEKPSVPRRKQKV